MRAISTAAMLVFVSGSAAVADTEIYFCLVSSRSPPCSRQADFTIGFDQFNAQFGAATAAEQEAKIVSEYCSYIEDGERKTFPGSAKQVETHEGGSHGSGLFLVRCYN